MKRRYVYGSVVAIILGFASYQLAQKEETASVEQHKVAYIDSKDADKVEGKSAQKTPDQVSAEEGIDAEQIVIKITDKGYVTSHGDHYHFYSGKVPYDAIISEELLMTDSNYVFKEEDVVNEVLDGYIIKIEGQYYLYLKSDSKRINVRTKKDIEDQQQKYAGHNSSGTGQGNISQMNQGKSGTGASSPKTVAGRRYTTDDGYVFDPTHIIDDLGDAFLVPHGNHYHYIPKKDLSPDELQAAQAYWNQKTGKGVAVATPRPGVSAAPIVAQPGKPIQPNQTPPTHVAKGPGSKQPAVQEDWRIWLQQLYALPLNQRHVEGDGLVFDPAQIVRRLDKGVVVPHGNHYHVIMYDKMSPLEQKIARVIPLKGEPGHPLTDPKKKQPSPIKQPVKPKKPTDPVKPKDPDPVMLTFQGRTFPAVKKGLDGKPYSTSDGYIFSKDSIYSVDENGITARHTDHFHFVPFNELEQYELDQVAEWLDEQAGQLMTLEELETYLDELESKAEFIDSDQVYQRYVDRINLLRERLAAIKAKTSKETVQTIQAEAKKLEVEIQKAIDNPTVPKHVEEGKTAQEVYEIVTPRLIVPVKDIPYHMHQTVEIEDDHIFVIPHTDHYHNINMEWFDDGSFEVPAGYTIEDLFATVKYYVQNPSARPKEDGWGDDSDHGSGNGGGNNLPPSEEPRDEDEYEVTTKRAYLARELGMTEEEIELFSTPDGPAFKYRHEDHYHVVLLSELDVTKPFDDGHGDDHGDEDSEEESPEKKGVAGIDYPTTDGFLFDGTGMQGWTNVGLLVNHNGHTHLLLKEDIAKSKWAHLLPKEDGSTASNDVTLTSAQTAQRQALADALKLPFENILVVTADNKVIGFNYPHEDHYDFVPVVDESNDSKELTDVEKRELTAYVRKAYGLLLGTPVDFKDNVVIFAIPHPHQDYDPKRDYYSDVLDPSYDKGHVHPYFVPISKLKIPAKTGIPELDFENELLAAAERLGVPVGQVKMKNDKYFVLPGSDHDHYLNIFSLDGLNAYRENSLQLIYPRIATGSFDKDSVVVEIDRIQEAAKVRFGDETLEYRRVRRALTQYREEIAAGHRSSSQAYLDALKAFENRYVLLQGDVPEETVNPLEEQATKLMSRINQLGNTKLGTYGTTVDALVNRVREAFVAQDSGALDHLESYLNAIARVDAAPNPHLPRVAYMDYFLRHVDSPYLSPALREAVSEKILELHQHDEKRTSFKPSLEGAVALKAQVKATIAAAQNQEIKLGTVYNKLNRMKVELVGRVNHWTNIFKYAITEEEKTDGLNGKLQVLPAIKPPKPKAPVEQPEKPKDSTPPSDQPKKPDTPTPSGGEEERLATWLREAPAYIKRYYGIDKREADLLVALEAKDATALSYVSAIHRIEVTNKNNYVGVRTAYLDYFIRQADQDYLSPELREKVASKAIFIQTASARDFKQVLIELIDLKSQVKAAQVAGQTYDIQDGPNYQAFVAKRNALIADVMERKDNLLRIGYITEEEKADGFGQAFPELRSLSTATSEIPDTSLPEEETTSSTDETSQPVVATISSISGEEKDELPSEIVPVEQDSASHVETTTDESPNEDEAIEDGE